VKKQILELTRESLVSKRRKNHAINQNLLLQRLFFTAGKRTVLNLGVNKLKHHAPDIPRNRSFQSNRSAFI